MGRAPVLDYAEFLGTSFAWISVLCFASIAFQYYADIMRMFFEVHLFFSHFYCLSSQPDFNKKSLLSLVAIYLELHVALVRLAMYQ